MAIAYEANLNKAKSSAQALALTTAPVILEIVGRRSQTNAIINLLANNPLALQCYANLVLNPFEEARLELVIELLAEPALGGILDKVSVPKDHQQLIANKLAGIEWF